ncbi:MAG: hypothetical protein ACOC0D_09480, partial [Spirochaeta sp.]
MKIIQKGERFVLCDKGAAAIHMDTADHPVQIYADAGDYPGVLQAAGDLQADMERVTDRRPELSFRMPRTNEAGESPVTTVLIGTFGRSRLIAEAASARGIDLSALQGKTEMFLTAVAEDTERPGGTVIFIAGSDKRGTIYGIYTLCEQIGVSPLHWWGDVPAAAADELYIEPGIYSRGEPKVRYRGIFIND